MALLSANVIAANTLGVGAFTRISDRTDNGDNTFTCKLVGDGMAPTYTHGDTFTYDSSVAFSTIAVDDVIVVELTIGTYTLTRVVKVETDRLTTRLDASTFDDSAPVFERHYLGQVT